MNGAYSMFFEGKILSASKISIQKKPQVYVSCILMAYIQLTYAWGFFWIDILEADSVTVVSPVC